MASNKQKLVYRYNRRQNVYNKIKKSSKWTGAKNFDIWFSGTFEC